VVAAHGRRTQKQHGAATLQRTTLRGSASRAPARAPRHETLDAPVPARRRAHEFQRRWVPPLAVAPARVPRARANTVDVAARRGSGARTTQQAHTKATVLHVLGTHAHRQVREQPAREQLLVAPARVPRGNARRYATDA
jgi:hypothetical protein